MISLTLDPSQGEREDKRAFPSVSIPFPSGEVTHISEHTRGARCESGQRVCVRSEDADGRFVPRI